MFIPEKNTWVVENAYLLFVPFRSIYSIISFVLGYYIKKNNLLFEKINKKTTVSIAVLSFFGFYAFKLLLNRNIIPMFMQIVSHPLTIICAMFIFLSFEKSNMNHKYEGTSLEKYLSIIASLSLESYLVQFLIISGISTLPITFPINLILCFIIVIICANILKKIDLRITKSIL